MRRQKYEVPTDYYISYGPVQVKTQTLKDAREQAKRISRETIFPINIVANGDVVETLVPKCDKSGRISFRTKRA